jgi:hypothetical protein
MRGPYGADGRTVPFCHARPPSPTVAKHARRRSAQGLVEPVRRENEQQPAVDGGQQVGLAEVDVAMVPDWLARAYSLG